VARRVTPEPQEKPRSLLVAENVTLWTLLGAISLFTAGEIMRAYQFEALHIRGLHYDVQWQDRVFEGGITLINGVTNGIFAPSLANLPWMIALTLFIVTLAYRRRVKPPWRRMLLAGFAGVCYLGTLILLSMHWGRVTAEIVRQRDAGEHFLFSPDAAPRLPPQLLRDNESRMLRTVLTTPDFTVLLSGDGKTVYRLATRDIELQESPAQ
jgi:hypothetical protein